MSPALRCPYCGQEPQGEPLSQCYWCEESLPEQYAVLIDEEGDAFALCSSKCMGFLFEYMEAEAGEEEEQ